LEGRREKNGDDVWHDTGHLRRIVQDRSQVEEQGVRPTRATKDRRVARTDALLHEALTNLVHEKPYDEVAVKEILDRANIGRSTFYTHFRDKDELLLSGMREMLRSSRPSGREQPQRDGVEAILWFALPVFEHIETRQRSATVPKGVSGRHAMHEQLRRAIVELVEDGVARGRRHGGGPPAEVPPDLVAGWIATTFIQVLDWWVESGAGRTASAANEHFRQLVEPSLSRILR
jgi:AcrR family transcriptional regulator